MLYFWTAISNSVPQDLSILNSVRIYDVKSMTYYYQYSVPLLVAIPQTALYPDLPSPPPFLIQV